MKKKSLLIITVFCLSTLFGCGSSGGNNSGSAPVTLISSITHYNHFSGEINFTDRSISKSTIENFGVFDEIHLNITYSDADQDGAIIELTGDIEKQYILPAQTEETEKVYVKIHKYLEDAELGEYEIHAKITDEKGNTSESITTKFTIVE